jgi:glycosyltransferase involved in cell wall biosynthesis
MAAPAVTVVVPVWDSYCDHLGESVTSALRQTDVDVRVIVVDNASERPVPDLGSEARIVRSDVRLEVGAARNLGLAAVETSYVTFLDADDVLLPDALAFLVRQLEADPQCVTSGGRFVSWNPETDERVVVRRAPKPAVLTVSRLRRSFALVNLLWNTFPVVGCVHRTSAVRDAGGFGDGSVGEDWILGAMLCFRGRIAFAEHETFLRRVHHGSLWYRPHVPEVLVERSRALRERASQDDAVPGWAKALLPLLAHVHGRAVRRATRAGIVEPESPVLSTEPGR